jgi:hypothetical protein
MRTLALVGRVFNENRPYSHRADIYTKKIANNIYEIIVKSNYLESTTDLITAIKNGRF